MLRCRDSGVNLYRSRISSSVWWSLTVPAFPLLNTSIASTSRLGLIGTGASAQTPILSRFQTTRSPAGSTIRTNERTRIRRRFNDLAFSGASSGQGGRRFKSFRPDHFSRFNVLHRVCCCLSRLGIGYIGCNIASSRRKFKTRPDLFCHFFSIPNVLSQLRVPVPHCLVRMAEPETNEILWGSALAEPSRPVTAEGMKAGLCLPQLYQHSSPLAVLRDLRRTFPGWIAGSAPDALWYRIKHCKTG